MSDLITLEDQLLAHGSTVETGPTHQCPSCLSFHHAFSILNFEDTWLCYVCLDILRVERLMALPPQGKSWADVRAQRRTLLEQSDWCEFSRKLTPEQKQAWLDYRDKLFDITEQKVSPNDVVWPEPPE